MAKELTAVDISDIPEMLRLAEEVRRTDQPRILRAASEDIAVLVPAKPRVKRRRQRGKSDADMETFWSSFGGWKDVDTDKLIEDIYASRRVSTRPPIEL